VATLRELLLRTGALKPETEKVLDEAFLYSELRRWQTNEDDDPHGHAWATSFHASSFPGDDPMACPRKSLYTMMGFARDEPLPGRVRIFAEMGKAIEISITRAYADTGMLISTDQSTHGRQAIQTGFEEPEYWLTGNADALVVYPFQKSPVVGEIKAKRLNKVTDIKQGLAQPVPEHERQLQTYLAGTHLHLHEHLNKIRICAATGFVADGITTGICRLHGSWECLKEIELEPVQSGFLTYAAFDDPNIRATFEYELDLDFYYTGLAKLAQWKKWFEDDHLPSLGPSEGRYPHPHGKLPGWGWSKEPCKYCPVQKICRADNADSIQTLTQSHGVRHTKEVRAPVGLDYDPQASRQAVFSRWDSDTEEIAA